MTEQVHSLSNDDFTAVLRVAQAEGTGTGVGLHDVRAEALPAAGSALVYLDPASLRKS